MRIHEQAAHYRAKADATDDALLALLDYVQSDKFWHSDNMVNCNDIIARIRESRDQIWREFE